MVFKPQTDLYILNAIANHIIKTGRVNKDFVAQHTVFKRGQTDIGYGLRPEHPLQKKATGAAKAGDATDMTLRGIREVRLRLHAGEGGRRCPACRLNRIEALAELYADPKTKVVSFWTMGFNQHTRGVWCNNLVYNIHLLTGKISEPGNSPFSLTGQPSACGTAREVGTFSHRLPADMVVTNKAHRDIAEQIWKLPEGTIPDKPGYHAVLQNRMLKDGMLNAYWVQVNNNMQAGGELPTRKTYPGYPQSGKLHRRLRRLSDRDGARRRSHPADRDVGGEGRRLRQRRAAHAVLAPAGRRAGRGAIGPVAADGVLQALQDRGGLARGTAGQEARIPRQDAVRRAVSRTVRSTSFRSSDIEAGYLNDESKAFGFYVQKGLFEEYAAFGRGHGHDLAPFDTYHQVRGLRWPVVNGQETAGASARVSTPM